MVEKFQIYRHNNYVDGGERLSERWVEGGGGERRERGWDKIEI